MRWPSLKERQGASSTEQPTGANTWVSLQVERLHEEAGDMPPGKERDGLMRKVRVGETAAHMSEC